MSLTWWRLVCAALCGAAPTVQAQTGPVITLIGITDASDQLIAPTGVTPTGDPIYQRAAGTAFSLVIEARPGLSQQPVGTATFNSIPGDPSARPDLQILTDRALGNGSAAVCDPSGGVPGTATTDFPLTVEVADALNDLACRFTATRNSTESCGQVGGDYRFLTQASTVQFCSLPLPSTLAFALGGSTMSVRVRDTAGNAGPVRHLVMQVGPVGPASTAPPTSANPTATATRSVTTSATRTPTQSASATATASPAATATVTPSWTATTTATMVSSATPSPPAECTLDGDGRVTEADVFALIGALFTPVPSTIYDVNGDALVNAADVTALFRLCVTNVSNLRGVRSEARLAEYIARHPRQTAR